MTASTPDPQGPLRRVPAAPGEVGPGRHDLAASTEPGSGGGARPEPAVSAAQPGDGGGARPEPAASAAQPGSGAPQDRVASAAQPSSGSAAPPEPAAPAAGSGWADPDGWDPGPPSAEVMAEQEAILAEHVAAGVLDEPPEDEWCRWLADPDAARDAVPDAAGPGPELEGPFPAGVIMHDRGGPGGPGFASGSALDRLAAGPALAAAADAAWQGGLAGLSDDELAGLVLAWRRCESRAAAGLLAGTAELARRRAGHGDWRVLEHLDSELALLFTLTRRSAGALLGFAEGLARLPATAAALAAGRIDRPRAGVLADETALLADDAVAAAVELLMIEDAPRLTTSKLRDRVRRAVLAADPAAARRRADKARRDARVERWDERSGGTAALAGRDLPVPAALAADQRIDHAARELKAAGAAATLAQLRAAVFLGLLTGADPATFLPPPGDSEQPPADGAPPASTSEPQDSDGKQPAEDERRRENGRPGGADADAGPPTDQPAAPASRDPAAPDVSGTSAQPTGPAGQDDAPGQRGDPQATPAGREDAAPDARAPAAWAPARPGLRGSGNLTMPLASWLGFTQSPGQVTAFGPLTAGTCRDLADHIAASPGARWCLTLTDTAGHAVGHGCAPRPPPPATDLAAVTTWLQNLHTGPIQAGDCSHAREVPGYRIPDSLAHLIHIRQQTCASPICSTPATCCDGDHTIPHDQGGRTCECGIAPKCRTDHQAKQAPGWQVDQPSPGLVIWRPPHGRSYTATPAVYPT